MGTTLHAILEVRWKYITTSIDIWRCVGLWNFGKDYALSGWLHENAPRGWPTDSFEAKRHDLDDVDRQHADLAMLEEAATTLRSEHEEDDPLRPRVRLDAPLQALRWFEKQGFEVRALFWRNG